jgi:uncharacterized membrane protein
MLALSTGCGRDEAPPADGTSPPVLVVPSFPTSPDLIGIWTVVGHHIPGISATSDAGARAKHGSTVRLTPSESVSLDHHCAGPSYSARVVPRDNYLATEFNLAPGSLTPLASLDDLILFEVSCNGVRWSAMGGLLLKIDANHALTPWDGVFYELERDHDFRAVGQEPFWHLEIIQGKEMRFALDVGDLKAVTPVPARKTDPRTDAQTYHAVTEANDLLVVIEKKPCTDSMSGKTFPKTVSVTLNGKTYEGCGGPADSQSP